MNSFVMLYQILLGAVFFISGIEKLLKMEEHKRLIFNYHIIPIRLITVFLPLLAGSELFVGVFLVILVAANQTLVAAGGLMALFTSAIIINLLRGRRDISCGCGGVIGNHNISWWLVLRNLFILIGVLFCLFREEALKAWTFQYVVTLCLAAVLLLCYLCIKNLIQIHSEAKRLIGRNIVG